MCNVYFLVCDEIVFVLRLCKFVYVLLYEVLDVVVYVEYVCASEWSNSPL